MKPNKAEYLILIIILLFAFYLRVSSLGNPPFWIDESISAKASEMILEKGVPVFNSGWYYGSASFLHYGMAFFMLFGQNEFFARFISVLSGLGTIILAYFIGKEYSKSGGIISALFFSVFYLEVFFSRQSRYYQLFQLAFFASLYFLYKSKEKPIYLLPALISFFIAINTHIEALVLAPFFIAHILYFNRKQWFLSILPAIPLITRLIPASKLSTGSVDMASNYVGRYFSYAANMLYLLILFIPGVILAFFKNSKNSDKKRLTLLIMLPSLLTLIGIFSLQTFAFRYAYFFAFPLILYSSLLVSFLYENYGKIMLITILALLIIPSNLFFPYTFVNIIKPIDYNFNDYSAPFTDYKNLPENLSSELKSNITLISYFSPDVEFYIRKPDYVIPFSMDGKGNDQISYNNSIGETVDKYSGALILKEIPKKPYYITADAFSVSKLKPSQKEFLNNLTEDCIIEYENIDLKVYSCSEYQKV